MIHKKGKFKGYHDIYNLCKMFEKNLSQLSTIMSAETDNNEQCRYLIFWLNDRIRNYFKRYNVPTNEQKIIITAFISVSHLVISGSSNNKCKYIYNPNIDLDLWKKWKDLYDYIKNKHKIHDIINSNKNLCALYPKYHTYITGIYKNYKSECCNGYNSNCPSELNFNEWCNMDNILTELKCIQPSEFGEYPEGDVQVIKAKPGEEDKELPNALISNSTGTIIGTTLGFVLSLITIFRFTPLGSWINTKIFRKNKLMENMERNERELLLYSSGIGEMNYENTRYHVMYNSSPNE
ncbi:CYIR protein [Plasmodium cynomolgi strain B]|uniref:CYIR protein n=1 Tax=Plasmodium cynomolgi (strain B) TaxID=1120755 RepID=K6UNM5_PLACD|nr:CYIR protein [Plasmodium cynomolgi strain B]GAB69633.1 CYIR protein [Plasmodium cynomolgi strain B]